MKQMIKTNQRAEVIICILLLLIGILTLPLGCKSVHKSQNEKFETATVKKSDSSSSKSYSYVDTTKTDSSTTITKTEVTIDSVEYDYVPKGDLMPFTLPKLKVNPNAGYCATGTAKAKGIKITTTTIKQAATQAKGVTIKEDVKQVDTNSDSVVAKTETAKETVKKAKPFSTAVGFGVVFLFIAIAVVGGYKIYKSFNPLA